MEPSIEQIVLDAVRTAGHPVSARNLARKIGVRRGIITRILYLNHDQFKKTLTRNLNYRHKKPVWEPIENSG